MAYVIPKPSRPEDALPYLPEDIAIPRTGETLVLDWYREGDYQGVYAMMREAVDEGQTYPQDTMDQSHFENYYLSHDAFVVRDTSKDKVVGSFYVKPNFPGRSSYICNAGFLVNRGYRNRGVGELLFRKYLRIARDLGYEGSFFNLVYATNQASVRICKKLGFSQIGIIPKAGKLKGLGYVDALQFYYDLTTLERMD